MPPLLGHLLNPSAGETTQPSLHIPQKFILGVPLSGASANTLCGDWQEGSSHLPALLCGPSKRSLFLCRYIPITRVVLRAVTYSKSLKVCLSLRRFQSLPLVHLPLFFSVSPSLSFFTTSSSSHRSPSRADGCLWLRGKARCCFSSARLVCTRHGVCLCPGSVSRSPAPMLHSSLYICLLSLE